MTYVRSGISIGRDDIHIYLFLEKIFSRKKFRTQPKRQNINGIGIYEILLNLPIWDA